jgi:Putative metallopeptidase
MGVGMVFGRAANMHRVRDRACRCPRTGVLLGLAMLLGIQLLGAEAAFAQSPPSPSPSFQERIEQVARGFADNPRFKGFSQQQRVERVEFVVGNTLFVLLHEIGHVLVSEMRLPVLGRREDVADTYAALRLIKIGSEFSQKVLVEASKGWFLSDRRDQQTGAPFLFYDEHDLNQQRAYQIVCLMVGADPVKFKEIADTTKLPEERRKSCVDDYAYASWSWDTVLAPHRRAPDQPKADIIVTYGDGQGRFDAYARTFRSVRLLDVVARVLADEYTWPAPIKLDTQTCGNPGARWDDMSRTLTLCYELAFDFAELHRAYGSAPLEIPKRVASANDRKRKVKQKRAAS